MLESYVEAALARQHDLLREAEGERLARAALAGRRQMGLRTRSMAWLGDRLIASGRRLQTRYGPIA